MTQILLSCRTTTSNGLVPDLPLDPLRQLQCWRARIAYRRNLARLLAAGPHLIRDMGLDEAEAREEIRKPFWQS